MNHRRGYRKLGRNSSHRRATLRNLVTNLLERERITTTSTRAKELRPLAEKMITLGKRDTLHTRRQAAAFLTSPPVVKKLFSTLAPRFADRPGGYVRIIPLGWRRGDGADEAIVELLGSELKPKVKKEKKKKAEPEAPQAPEASAEGKQES
ncbi:MAG TPA: 50S ribosomal protein L17 [Candidatus Acidoferrales bacterium]|nr:50S ribosomal protein L17 [Candidatus Acidoferrales bacterium]